MEIAYGVDYLFKKVVFKRRKKVVLGHLLQTVGSASHSSLGIFHFPSHIRDLPSTPIFSTRKPQPWNIHFNDCRVFVGYGDKNNQLLPLQASTDNTKRVCTRRYCHHSSKQRYLLWTLIFLFSTTQGHLSFPRQTGSHFSVGQFRSLPLSHPPRSSSGVALSSRTFFDHGNVLYLLSNTVTTSHMWLFNTWNVGSTIKKLHFLLISF